MTASSPHGARHVSRLVPSGPRILPAADHAGASRSASADDVTLVRTVGADPEALGRLLAAVEPLRADASATVVTDADAEVVRFLAVLAVLEGREEMPDYDLDDPSLKWHAKKGVKAVPNAPTIISAPTSGGVAGAAGGAS